MISSIRKWLRINNWEMCLDKIRGEIDNIHFVPPVKNFYHYLPSNKIVRIDLFPATALAKPN
jgi:hypothetical protein